MSVTGQPTIRLKAETYTVSETPCSKHQVTDSRRTTLTLIEGDYT